jgi:cell division protease FtsH
MNRGQFRFSLWFFLAAMVALLALNAWWTTQRTYNDIEYSRFRDLIESGVIRRVELGPSYYRGFAEPNGVDDSAATGNARGRPKVYRTVVVDDPALISLLEERNVEYYAVPQQESPLVTFLVSWLLPFVLLLAIWRMMFNRIGRAGPDVLSFGRNRGQIVSEGETGVRFDDVAGAEEAKVELVEVVEFLIAPERYAAVGGRVPKGVLMVGAPGTGKTLLARAAAGEAGVPFFRMSGADFVEMFVGVGAARVRDLFRQAREKSPCIIFIDELDAIGKSRAQQVGGHDEREQTLNQLLVEMDGFDARSGVIVLAATNRPEILDPALMRPGRFDRQVLIDKPDVREREAILRKHAETVKLDQGVDLRTIAAATPGLVGADLANIVNEAALLAVREGRDRVQQADFEEAIEKAVAGLKKKNRLMNPEERRRVAYHEAGHALVSLLTPGTDPVQKVSIVPRGYGALGYTLQLPTEDRYLLTEQDLLSRVDVLLAGRAAEEVIFGSISTGASDDITKATDIIRRMFTEYGMSEAFRNVYLPFRKGGQFLNEEFSLSGREFAEETQRYLDTETARVVAERYERVLALLCERRPALEAVAQELLEREVVDRGVLERLVAAGGDAPRGGSAQRRVAGTT